MDAWRAMVAFAAIFLVMAQGAWADQAVSPPPFKKFSFKRVGVPTAPGPRITVRINPEDSLPPTTAQPEPEAEAAAAPAPDVLREFWAAVSPRIEDASPARLEPALVALQDVDGVSWPRLDDVRRITDLYGSDILRQTVGTRVSPALVAAIISVESSGRPGAVSHAGAAGLMQLMPDTAARFGVKEVTEAAENIRGGVAYLDWLMGEFGLDPVLTLAGYNAGEGSVHTHRGVPPFAETRAYIPKVLAAFRVASGLCLTPPELITDGCVFIRPES